MRDALHAAGFPDVAEPVERHVREWCQQNGPPDIRAMLADRA
jgi:hypothetical protein